MRHQLVIAATVAACTAAAAWGCGSGYSSSGGSSGTPTSPSGGNTGGTATTTIAIVGSIGNQAFQPNPVSASAGQTLAFKNDDATRHHIVLDDGSADLGNIDPGGTSQAIRVTSSKPVNFHCTIHPSMVGSINGQTAPQSPPCSDPYGSGCN